MNEHRISDEEVERLRAAGVAVPTSLEEVKKLLEEAELDPDGLPLDEAFKEIRVLGRTKLFANILFSMLEEMDREATTLSNGAPTGLYWYGAHAKPNQKRPSTEAIWTQRLCKLLCERGYSSNAEVPYPRKKRTKCDLAITLPEGCRLRIEIKGAWKEFWRKKGSLKLYRSYLLHPCVANLVSKTHTVPLDMKKLAGLNREEADVVAILLIGFDTSAHPMDADIAELQREAGLDGFWHKSMKRWDDPYRPGGRVNCWCWFKTVREDP
jgi:hypothetical protein